VQDDEVVLEAVNDNPSSHPRCITSETGLSQSAVWRVLRENSLHLFIYNLCKGYNQRTKSIILSIVDGFYTVS
jgi:hypothetical protein